MIRKTLVSMTDVVKKTFHEYCTEHALITVQLQIFASQNLAQMAFLGVNYEIFA